MAELRVLSLFDGISCAIPALENAGHQISEYVSYEIDEATDLPLLLLARNGFTRERDVRNIRKEHLQEGRFDLVVAGSPCQGFSQEGKRTGLKHEQSGLFYEFVKVLDSVKPKFWMLENVVMGERDRNTVTGYLGEVPRLINASQVSGCRRPRAYWTNFDYKVEEWIGVWPMAILDFEKDGFIPLNWHTWASSGPGKKAQEKSRVRVFSRETPMETFSICQMARQYASWHGNVVNLGVGRGFRFFDPEELEALHNLPIGWTRGMKRGQRYKALGNGWANQVTTQIFRGIE